MIPTIPIEETARMPRPGWAIPGSPAFSPDDRFITFLFSPEGGLVQQLYAFDRHSNQRFVLVTPPGEGATEENLSLEEKLRRERARQWELGVTAYRWAPNQARLLVPFPDGLYVQDGVGAELRKLVNTARGPVLDPRFSPDGEWIGYVQANELWIVPASGGDARQVTTGASESGRTHGLAEYIAQEELDRPNGFWWSEDSRWLAFEAVDETHIPVYRIIHQGKDQTGEGAQENHRYPFAGQANAKVHLGVVGRDGGAPVWMDLGTNEDVYLARACWLPGGALLAQVLNREQTTLDLVQFDPGTGQAARILRETNNIWINLHDAFHPIKTGKYAGGFIMASEQTGFRHLYRYDAQGKQQRALTSGEWMVENLAGVDEENGLVYFTGTRHSPLETHLYAIPLENENTQLAEPRRITQVPGTHMVVLDHACRTFIDTHSAINVPPHISLRSLADGSLLKEIFENTDPRITQLGLKPPEMVALENRDGVRLYGAIYRPESGNASYPTIVSVYGGPHAQMVTDSWRMTTDMRAQYLRQQGFLVFVLDNRGSARRGLAFEGVIKHHMGSLEVQDQVDGVRWLVQQGLADAERVGIYGWSYGGYMAAMCLARAPETFRAAVAGAPVTAWDGYDTGYTERYMGTPQSNPEGYASSSVMHYVDQMRGRLMLVHGLIDENVHFRHTARLINALIQARKTYDLLLFPDERHMPRRLEDRVYMEEQIVGFFKRELGSTETVDQEAFRQRRK